MLEQQLRNDQQDTIVHIVQERELLLAEIKETQEILQRSHNLVRQLDELLAKAGESHRPPQLGAFPSGSARSASYLCKLPAWIGRCFWTTVQKPSGTLRRTPSLIPASRTDRRTDLRI